MDRCFYSERDEVGLLSPHPQLCQRLRGRLLVQTDLPCPGPRDVPSALCMGQGPQAPVLGPLTSSLRADTSGDHPASVLRGGGEEVGLSPAPSVSPCPSPLAPPAPQPLRVSLALSAGWREGAKPHVQGVPGYHWLPFEILQLANVLNKARLGLEHKPSVTLSS